MSINYFEEAYRNLICNADTDADNILYRLSDWLCKFLDSDNGRVLYFTLPIWDYLTNSWNSHFPIGISRINEPNFITYKEKWIKNNNEERELNIKGTRFDNFYSDSNLNSNGFSFVEFVTQNSTGIDPVFIIEFADDKTNPSTRFEFHKNRLILFNNNQNSYETYVHTEAFISCTYKLLTSDVNLLNKRNREDLQSLYVFLCKYQKWFGKDVRYIYLVTSRLYKSTLKDISSGGLILVCKDIIDIEKLYIISVVINLCYRERGGKNWANKSRVEAIKSAKAAIMSRNMSHNLGSHVMSYLKQHLSSVTTMMRDNVLHEIISYGTEDSLPSWNKTISRDSVNENIALPFLVGIGHFVSYLQERQDFIATIATDYIPYNSTVNFKDNVYDELNPDKRYERHSERSNMKIDNILLGNIARSEGLGRHTSPTIGEGSKLCDIVLKFGDFDGGLRSSEKDLGRLRDFDVSLPGGIVGRQAIFSIFENVIRNAAKHGNWKSSGKLELTIDYYSKNTINTAPDTDQYSDKEHKGCHSLRKVLTDFYAEAQDGEDLYFVTITDNSETDIEHLAKLRKSLCDSYLKNANKGLKEMRISASWLRSINDEDGCYNPYLPYLNDDELLSSDLFAVNDKKLKAPILYARLSVPGMFLPPNLQYIFCLPIPREVALITSEHSDIDWKTRMINCNWRVFTENENVHEFLNQELNKSFDFILCDTKDMYDIIRPYTSAKTFYLSDPQLKFTLEQFKEDVIDKDSILEALYKRISGNTNGEIIMIDDSTVFINAKQLYEEGKCEKISVIAEDSDKEPYNIKKITIHHKGKKEGSENTDVVEIEQELRKEEFVGFPHGTYYKVGPIVVGNAVKPVYTKYMYRTHHEAWEQFIGFMGNSSGYDVKYVEGITGNNATDRLVRHDPLTMKWYYSHIHSMKQSVAIIDERIFYKIYGIDEASFVRGKAYVSKIDSTTKETDRIKDLNNAKRYYKTILPEESYNRIEDASDMNTLQSIVSDDYAATIRCNAVYSKGYQGYAYFQKNIMVYTFIPAVEPHKFEIVGINIKNRKPEINESFECVCVPIAVLSWDGKDFKVDSLSIETKFDFITIHQGLLDKLYEAFDIKEDVNAKNKIVAGLYKSFSSHSEGEIINNNFYPGFFIHSGRSKPGVEVMSQKVPFIQYATLEHAVLDCKYSLVELLDNARYE